LTEVLVRQSGITRSWRSLNWRQWREPASATLIMLALWAVGIAFGVNFLPPGYWNHGTTVAGHLLSWDGLWYQDIARHGYHWDPRLGILLKHYENIAFYPLHPVIERLIMAITQSRAPAVLVLPGIGFGIASIFTFHRLVRALLPPETARRATMLYAIWPASIFYAMGYPTGLINLCAIAALAAYVERRYWRAFLWCGIGTAAAPTIVFVAAGLCLDQGIRWLRARLPLRDIPRLVGFGIVSVSGMILFMLYQLYAFHDAFAFIKAQAAWGAAPPLDVRVVRLVDPSWYLHMLGHADWLHSHYQYNEQLALNAFSLLVAAFGIAAAFRVIRPLALPLAGLAGLIGYLWFIVTTDQNIASTPRLLFPAVMLFAGLAALTARSRLAYAALFAALSVLTVLNATFAVTNYFLI
jgi:hypothetical protein